MKNEREVETVEEESRPWIARQHLVLRGFGFALFGAALSLSTGGGDGVIQDPGNLGVFLVFGGVACLIVASVGGRLESLLNKTETLRHLAVIQADILRVEALIERQGGEPKA